MVLLGSTSQTSASACENADLPNLRSALISAGNRVPSGVASRLRSNSWVTRPARAVANRLLPENPTLVTVRSGRAEGVRLLIYPRSEKFFWTGTHEPEVQDAIVDLLRPGMTFWDVGAHVGYFTLLASRVVGPSGTVHAFEPMPATFRRLTASITANGAGNVIAHELALAPISGPGSLHGGDVSVLWSLRPEQGPDSVAVQCQTLAEACDLHGAPDLLKVDAEGAEIDILVSGWEALAARRTRVLLETASDAEVDVARERLPFYEVERVNDTHWLLTVCAETRPGMPKAE